MLPRKQSLGVLMVSLFLTAAAWAQVSRGTITGIATDPSGESVPGVEITITNIKTGVANKVKANESGGYAVPLLEGANYPLSAQKAGFKRYVQSGILVQSGGTALQVSFVYPDRRKVQEVTRELMDCLIEADFTVPSHSEDGAFRMRITPDDLPSLPRTAASLSRINLMRVGLGGGLLLGLSVSVLRHRWWHGSA